MTFDDFILTERCYFFQTSTGKGLDQQFYQTALKKIRTASEMVETPKFEIPYSSHVEKDTRVTACVFKRRGQPTFLDGGANFVEEFYCYVLFIEYKGFVAVSKSKIRGLDAAIEGWLIPLPYELSSKALMDEQSTIQEVSARNTDPRSSNIRDKTLAGSDLSKGQSPVSNWRFALRQFQLENDKGKYTLGLRTSLISKKSGTKVTVKDLALWVKEFVEDVIAEKGSGRHAVINSFAKPINFKTRPKDLVPVELFLNTGAMEEEVGESFGFWDFLQLGKERKHEKINAVVLAPYIDRPLRLNNPNGLREGRLEVLELDGKQRNQRKDSFNIEISKTKIKIQSKVLGNLYLPQGNSLGDAVESLYNRTGDFIVVFNRPEYIYFNHTLFQSDFMASNLKIICSVFKGYSSLENVSSEKGKPRLASKEFDRDSMFYFIEHELVSEDNPLHLFCDDLGMEAADYIGIKEGHILFYHAKAAKDPNKPSLSASAFHVLLGQVQKNLGMVRERNGWMDVKFKGKWNMNYQHQQKGGKPMLTQISRNRSHTRLDDAWKMWIQIPNLVNKHFTIYAVINTISAKQIKLQFQKLANGERVRASVYQLAWMIATTISACEENKIDFKIACLP